MRTDFKSFKGTVPKARAKEARDLAKVLGHLPTNKDRAIRFALALRSHATHGGLAQDAMEDDARDVLADLLADARHYCDRYGLAFGEIDALAHRNYSAEVVEERKVRTLARGTSTL